MAKRMLLMLIAVTIFFGAIFGWKAFVSGQIRASMAARGAPVATVSTAPVQTAGWLPTISTITTLSSAQSVDVTAQLGGQITALHFESGDLVKAGALLVQQYVADAQAQLKAAQADLRLAEIDLGRLEKLVQERVVSESELDAARSRRDRAQAETEALQVAIDKKSIRAPFTGRLGLRKVNLGQYIEPGDPIVRLEAVDQLYADFRLPQGSLPLLHIDQAVTVKVDAWPDVVFTGRIRAIEPAVDPGTRNVSVRAELDNSDGRLRPGMFGDINIALPARSDVLTVTQAAITFSPFGNSVYVIREEDGVTTVHNVYVGTGEKRGDLIEITSGLSAGDQVVTSGQLKLREAARVNIDNSVPVSSDPEPRPAES